MPSFTLDTNCIIDVAENRPNAADILKLADAHTKQKAHVAVAAVSASERQQGDYYLDSYEMFRERLETLGLGHLAEIMGIGYHAISYWNHALYPNDAMIAREVAIHGILFPIIPFQWSEFAAQTGVNVDAVKDDKAKKWRNAFCDRQMYWAHDHANRDIFVTRDRNYKKLMGRKDFPRSIVMTPDEAVQHV